MKLGRIGISGITENIEKRKKKIENKKSSIIGRNKFNITPLYMELEVKRRKEGKILFLNYHSTQFNINKLPLYQLKLSSLG